MCVYVCVCMCLFVCALLYGPDMRTKHMFLTLFGLSYSQLQSVQVWFNHKLTYVIVKLNFNYKFYLHSYLKIS